MENEFGHCITCGHVYCNCPVIIQDDYTCFIKGGLAIGFTDDQVDFLWDWLHADRFNKNKNE